MNQSAARLLLIKPLIFEKALVLLSNQTKVQMELASLRFGKR